jgi:hypothetical protein
VKLPQLLFPRVRPPLTPARRAATIASLVLLGSATLLLSVLTLVLLMGLVLAFHTYADSIPLILLTSALSGAGVLRITFTARRLARRS